MAENPRTTDLRRRLEKEPGSRLFAQLAEELRKDGELEEAIRIARDGLQRHPAFLSARMTLGRALFDAGEFPGARTEFEGVLKAAADNILASRLLGECLEKAGELEAALSRYRTTLLLAPGDKQVQSRIQEVEARLKGPAPAVPTRAPVSPPVVPPEAKELPPARVEEPAILVAPEADEPAPIPLVAVEDDAFELERPYEAPVVETRGTPVLEVPEPSSAAPVVLPAPAVTPAPVVGGGEEAFEFDFGGETVPPADARREVIARPLVVEEEPAAPLASATLGELYSNQGHVDKAIAVYRQVLAREPGNEQVRLRLGELEAQALGRHTEGQTAGQVDDPKLARRRALERTIGRLEGLLAAVKRG